jgi:hypothetical protein
MGEETPSWEDPGVLARVAAIDQRLEPYGLKLIPNDDTEPGGTWLIVSAPDLRLVIGGSAGLSLSAAETWASRICERAAAGGL